MKTSMGQFGPRLSVCLGLQPCNGAPSLVMGLINLTARVKAQVGGLRAAPVGAGQRVSTVQRAPFS